MKPARILIVDDEPLIRQSLAGVLEDEGYQTHAVATGEECCEELRAHAYDLVLLDVWLPGMDGLETLARIQEIPFANRPAVVIISGHGTIETAVKATKLGAFDFIEKPLDHRKSNSGGEECAAAAPAGTGTGAAERGRPAAAADHRRKRSHEGSAPAVGADGRHQWPRVDLW